MRNPRTYVRRHPPSSSTVAALGVVAAFTVALATSLSRQLHFYGDDYSLFWQARTVPLRERLWLPVGSQVIPLHQLGTTLLYQATGMRFGPGIAILAALHLLGVVGLYRLLTLVRRSTTNALVAAAYGMQLPLWIELGWWSAGFHRLSYVVLALQALHAHVEYTRTGLRRHLVVVACATLLGVGFYPKAVLVPLTCLLVDAVRRRDPAADPAFALRDAWKLAVLAGTTALSLGYVLVSTVAARAAPRHTLGLLDPLFQLRVLSGALSTLAHELLGVTLSPTHHVPRPWVAAAWLLLVGTLLRRAPRAAAALAGGLAAVAANVLMVGVSNRTGYFGDVVAYEARYTFDLMLVAWVFLGLAAHFLEWPRSLGRLVASPRGGLLVTVGVGLSLSLAAVLSFRAQVDEVHQELPDAIRARRFMDHLTADLARMHAATGDVRAPFVDTGIPVYFNPFDMQVRRMSQLFQLMDEPATFRRDARARWLVTEDGHVVRRDVPRPSRASR